MKIDDETKKAIFIEFYLRRICKSLEELQKAIRDFGEPEKELPDYDEDWWFPFRRRRV